MIGKTVYKSGIVFSSFDLLHVGHLHFLRTANDQCEKFYIGLHVDPNLERLEKNIPIQGLTERFMQLRFTFPDAEIIPYETEEDLIQILHLINPEVRFVGSDYVGKKITGGNLCTVKFIPRKHSYSSTELRERIYMNGTPEQIQFSKELIKAKERAIPPAYGIEV